VSRSTQTFQIMHDVGGAAWFGGSLMGLVGVNGAGDTVHTRDERAPVATVGWARWTPVQVVMIGVHVVGGLGLLLANRDRAAHQRGVRGNTVVKALLTLAAGVATLYSGILGGRIGQAGDVPADGSVTPNEATPADVADAQRRLRGLQYVIPALTGTIVALGAQQSQLQRPEHQSRGYLRDRLDAVRDGRR
jgi:hypothetical protein